MTRTMSVHTATVSTSAGIVRSHGAPATCHPNTQKVIINKPYARRDRFVAMKYCIGVDETSAYCSAKHLLYHGRFGASIELQVQVRCTLCPVPHCTARLCAALALRNSCSWQQSVLIRKRRPKRGVQTSHLTSNISHPLAFDGWPALAAGKQIMGRVRQLLLIAIWHNEIRMVVCQSFWHRPLMSIMTVDSVERWKLMYTGRLVTVGGVTFGESARAKPCGTHTALAIIQCGVNNP